MDERPPPFHRTRAIARECLLWMKTEWRFHLALGTCAVALSLGWAIHSNDPTFFARSGALLTIAGAIMSYRGYFRGKDVTYLRDTGQADRRAFSYWRPFASKEEAVAEDRRAFHWGLIAFVIGTLIWAYGDFVLPKTP